MSAHNYLIYVTLLTYKLDEVNATPFHIIRECHLGIEIAGQSIHTAVANATTSTANTAALPVLPDQIGAILVTVLCHKLKTRIPTCIISSAFPLEVETFEAQIPNVKLSAGRKVQLQVQNLVRLVQTCLSISLTAW